MHINEGGATASSSVPSLRLNNGPVVRALTKDDPEGRGFPWKWKIRQIVQLEGKAEAGCVDQREFIRKLRSGNSTASRGTAESQSDAVSVDIQEGADADD